MNQKSITNIERECISDVLRNIGTIVEGLIYSIENKNASSRLTRQDLLREVQSVHDRLADVVSRLKEGSFCALRSSECAMVSKYLGCCKQRNSGEARDGNEKRRLMLIDLPTEERSMREGACI